MAAMVVYKIMRADELAAFRREGRFFGAGADLADGFIHLSGGDQVAGTVERYFSGLADVMLVAVDATKLADALRWEESRGGVLFPHLYGVLEYAAVVAVGELAFSDEGRVSLPG